MQRTDEDTILTDVFLACFFICNVNYVKINPNNTATNYLEKNMIT